MTIELKCEDCLKVRELNLYRRCEACEKVCRLRERLMRELRRALHELGEFIDLSEGGTERRVADELIKTVAFELAVRKDEQGWFVESVFNNLEHCGKQ